MYDRLFGTPDGKFSINPRLLEHPELRYQNCEPLTLPIFFSIFLRALPYGNGFAEPVFVVR
jgi:hypothetical protein